MMKMRKVRMAIQDRSGHESKCMPIQVKTDENCIYSEASHHSNTVRVDRQHPCQLDNAHQNMKHKSTASAENNAGQEMRTGTLQSIRAKLYLLVICESIPQSPVLPNSLTAKHTRGTTASSLLLLAWLAWCLGCWAKWKFACDAFVRMHGRAKHVGVIWW